MKKVALAILIALIGFVIPTNYAYAIGNPNTIEWGTGGYPLYKIFYNVLETGDWLITAEGYVHYLVEPTDYKPEEAFMFELLDITGTSTLASRPLQAWGDRPISIYLTASQATALGLVVDSAYWLRIMGNPAIFASQTGNTITAQLNASSYVDYSTSDDTPEGNNMRIFMMLIAKNMEAEDAPIPSYLTYSYGVQYLSLEGGVLFIEGVPGLNYMCPVLFSYSIEPVGSDTPTSTGAYALTLTPTAKWGATTGTALTHIGLWLGINQELAGSAVAIFLGVLLAIFVYKKMESGVATLMIMGTYPFFIAWLGLMPLALAFVAMMIIVILGGWFFFRQGAL